jgi:membrane-associated protein
MDTQSLLESFGYLMIFLCVFIESGVILGLVLPLPGFSLLFTAGVLAAGGQMNLAAVMVIGSVAAILGYIAGYYTGSRYGRRLFYEKKTSKYFTPEQGQATERFMKKYGYGTLFIGRFLPVVHNVAPLLSGVAKTPLGPFMIANVIGGVLWVITSTLLGFYIGKAVPDAQKYVIAAVVLTIIFVNTPWGRRLWERIGRRIENL